MKRIVLLVFVGVFLARVGHASLAWETAAFAGFDPSVQKQKKPTTPAKKPPATKTATPPSSPTSKPPTPAPTTAPTQPAPAPEARTPPTEPAKPAAPSAPPARTASGQQLPGMLVLDNPTSKPPYSPFAGNKGKTPFDHPQHVAYEGSKCVTCHHSNSTTLTKALEETVPKCTECHQAKDAMVKFKGADKKAIAAKEAFHGDSSVVGCIGCHTNLDADKYPRAFDVGNECGKCHTNKDTIPKPTASFNDRRRSVPVRPAF